MLLLLERVQVHEVLVRQRKARAGNNGAYGDFLTGTLVVIESLALEAMLLLRRLSALKRLFISGLRGRDSIPIWHQSMNMLTMNRVLNLT